jgi:hypothetical protein
VKRALVLLMACAAPPRDVVEPGPVTPAPIDAQVSSPMANEQVPEEDTGEDTHPEIAPITAPPGWLRGSTHVHARPSGDSSTPIPDVIAWYEHHNYDFIVLTDHNKVSEIAQGNDTHGQPAVSEPPHGLIVIAGSELTNNPSKCIPAGIPNKCRIHVNVLGATARPAGKIEWANRKSDLRVDKYQAAITTAKWLGGLVQINHPQWNWGMTPDVLIELVKRGASFMEIANAQFRKWDKGDKDHLSTEALWDAALSAGMTIWGVASDDAHDYAYRRGKYPAGGAWIAVRARRDSHAILDALAAGQFYASTGVLLEHAEVAADELVVEVAANEPGDYTIEFIEAGKVVATTRGRSAKRAIPQAGYVRAVVTRDDGKKAWTQPARR